MPSRRGPSRRDQDFAQDRALAGVQQMVPGSVGGRVKSAAQPYTDPRATGRGAAVALPDIVFTYAGAVAANVLSPPYRTRTPLLLLGVELETGTPGTGTDTTVQVLAGGTVIATATLPAGGSGSDTLLATPVNVAKGARVQVRASAVGSGLADLVAQLVVA